MPNKLCGLACLVAIAGGCGGSSQGDEVRDARMERVEERAEVREEAVDQREDARDEAVEQRYDAKEERVEASNQPGEDANEDLVGISKQRAEYKAEAQTRLDKLATRLNTAQQKIKVLGTRASLPMKTELKTAAKQYDTMKQDVELLDQTPPDKWESTTKQLEERESGLEERVTKLEDKIDDE